MNIAPSIWQEEAPHRWRCSNGAVVERWTMNAKRPWYAVDPSGHNLCGRLYADWEIGTGATRTFATAQAAMKAMDKVLKERPPHGR